MTEKKLRVIWLALVFYAAVMVPTFITMLFCYAFTGADLFVRLSHVTGWTALISLAVSFIWSADGDTPLPLTEKGRRQLLDDRDLREITSEITRRKEVDAGIQPLEGTIFEYER